MNSPQLLPAYPPTNDISYATWLKQFARQLPAVAGRYGLSVDEVLVVQRIAAEFADWLVCRVQYATQAIAERQLPAAGSELATTLPPGPANLFWLDHIGALVQRIRLHPTYCAADGCALGLASSPGPAQTPSEGLPTPRLRVLKLPAAGAAPVLTWTSRRDTTVQVEVCRDGTTWLLLPAGPKHYEDGSPQPAQPARWLYRARYCWPQWLAGKWTRPVAVAVGPAR